MRVLSFVFLMLTASASAQNVLLTPIATGLEMPVALAHAGDTRLFIALQRGRIVIYDGTAVLTTPFLDIRSLVACCGERGLLGLAFHPRARENGFFFVYYTRSDGDIVVARYRVSSDPNRADHGSATILLTIEHSQFSNHNGGQLAFGPDGYLYFGTGDGGSQGDPSNRAQNLGDYLGKIHRIDVDSGSPYAIPSSNPFVQTPGALREIWAYGLRNPWRFSFDRETGDLWIADVGQNLWEEVDLQPRTSAGGENYGWRRMEGTHCFNPPTGCFDPTLTMPIFDYSHAAGRCSITGGYRYRGARMPSLRGMYLYGDYCTGTIWAATQELNGTWSALTVQSIGTMALSSFGEDLNGELYALDVRNGIVYAFSEKMPPRRRAVRK
jgi:glucose/arabinose dehydrogenase